MTTRMKRSRLRACRALRMNGGKESEGGIQSQAKLVVYCDEYNSPLVPFPFLDRSGDSAHYLMRSLSKLHAAGLEANEETTVKKVSSRRTALRLAGAKTANMHISASTSIQTGCSQQRRCQRRRDRLVSTLAADDAKQRRRFCPEFRVSPVCYPTRLHYNNSKRSTSLTVLGTILGHSPATYIDPRTSRQYSLSARLNSIGTRCGRLSVSLTRPSRGSVLASLVILRMQRFSARRDRGRGYLAVPRSSRLDSQCRRVTLRCSRPFEAEETVGKRVSRSNVEEVEVEDGKA